MYLPMHVVAIRTRPTNETFVKEGIAFANSRNCGFSMLHDNDIDALVAAFDHLVGAYWVYRDDGEGSGTHRAQDEKEAIPFANLAPEQSLERLRVSAKMSAQMGYRRNDAISPTRRRIEVIDELY